MTEHTKEPWRAAGVEVVGDHPQQRFIIAQPFTRGSEGPVLSYGIQEANASRIVAAVNACAGLTDAELSHGPVLPLHRHSHLASQRDDLLTALERLQRWAEVQVGCDVSGDHPIALARVAITNAGGKA